MSATFTSVLNWGIKILWMLMFILLLFQGSYVYYQTGTDGTSGSVQRLQMSQVFQGLPNDIDAATLWTGNNKAYFFKGKSQ